MSTPNYYSPNPFVEYGKATKKYGIVRIVWSIVLMVTMYGMASLATIFDSIDPNDPDAFTTISEADIAGVLLYVLLLIIGFILLFGFLINYLMKLNKLANFTAESNIKKVFWLEITNIFLVIPGALIFGEYATFIKLGIFIVIVFLLEKWAQSIPSQPNQPPLNELTKSSFLIMKIGAIYALIISIITTYMSISGILSTILLNLGQILWGFGFIKIGGEIVSLEIVQSAPSIQIEPVFNQNPNSFYGAPSYQTTPSNPQTYGTTTNFHNPSTLNNIGGESDKCKFCGATLIDKKSSFCSACGQKLR